MWTCLPRQGAVSTTPSHQTGATCDMRRSSVWEAAQIIKQLGVGSKLAKLDLHNAYRMVPVHPDDHCLLGVHWGEVVFIDTALPFWS